MGIADFHGEGYEDSCEEEPPCPQSTDTSRQQAPANSPPMTTLPLFWHLSSASKSERINASVKLIGALERFQKQFTPDDSPESSGDEEDADGQKQNDGLDALNAQDVSYSIRRLVRGLASPRESSRLGFAVALTELLSRINTVTCSQIIALIIESSKTRGSMTGQEERDVLFARLFGLTAVIQSGLLVRSRTLQSSASSATNASSLSSFQDALMHLIALGEKKSWLRESAWWTIALAADALKDSDVSWRDEAVEAMIQSIFVEYKSWSPEKVALTLKLQSVYPDRDWSNLMAPSFKNPNLLNGGNLNNLSLILKESGVEGDDLPRSSVGGWKPQVHFVWDVILDQLLSESSSPKGSFQEFFRIAVDESLFSPSASLERKYWGFQVFQKALPRVNASNLPMLFTKNFMRTWINHLSQNDRYLNKAARQVATEIRSYVQNNPALGFALILQLTGVNGSSQFDRLTKTKTVESILASMDASGIKNYIEYLLKQVDQDGGAEKADMQSIDSRRTWAMDQLSTLIRNGAIPKSDEWVQTVLDWFIVNGLFTIEKKSSKSSFRALRSVPTPVFSEKQRQYCIVRLFGCLTDLTDQPTLVKIDGKTSKMSGVASDGDFWISKVLTTIRQLEKDTKHVTVITKFDEPTRALHVKARELAARLNKITGEQEDAAKGTELLLLATLLQQYCANESDESDTEILKASIDGATRMFPESKKGKSRESATQTATDTPYEPVDVLVDVIITYLEKSSAYLRAVGNQVFSLLSGHVQKTTIELILAQLEKHDLTDEDEEMSDEEGENESDDDESSSESQDDDDDDDDDGDESHQATDTELRQKIEEALQANGIEASSDESGSDSDSDSSVELMDDEQMLAVDEKLAAVFKAKAGEKKSQDIDAQRQVTHFKIRVLSLVDTFIKRQPSSPYIIYLASPLVDLVAGASPDERQLSDKAKSLLRSRIGKLKEIPPTVDTEQVVKVLDDLHSRARKIQSPEIAGILNQCSLYLVKLLLHFDKEKPVVDAYRQSFTSFITRKNSPLSTSFFQDFFRLHAASAWNLRHELIELSTKAANVYRRCQVFHILQVLMTQLPAKSEKSQEILDFMPSLRQAIFDLACAACDGTVSLHAQQMRDLLKFAMFAIHQTKKLTSEPEKISLLWQPAIWDELCEKLAASKRFKGASALKTTCKQIAQLTRSTAVTKADKSSNKRKVEEVDGREKPKEVKRKKIKKNKA